MRGVLAMHLPGERPLQSPPCHRYRILGVRKSSRRVVPCVFSPSGSPSAAEGQRMDRLFFSLLTLALQWFRPRYNAQLQLLQAQIRILRSRTDVGRIIPTPQEKQKRAIRLTPATTTCCVWDSQRQARTHRDLGVDLLLRDAARRCFGVMTDSIARFFDSEALVRLCGRMDGTPPRKHNLLRQLE